MIIRRILQASGEKKCFVNGVIYTNGIKVSSILGTRTRCNIYFLVVCLFQGQGVKCFFSFYSWL